MAKSLGIREAARVAQVRMDTDGQVRRSSSPVDPDAWPHSCRLLRVLLPCSSSSWRFSTLPLARPGTCCWGRAEEPPPSRGPRTANGWWTATFLLVALRCCCCLGDGRAASLCLRRAPGGTHDTAGGPGTPLCKRSPQPCGPAKPGHGPVVRSLLPPVPEVLDDARRARRNSSSRFPARLKDGWGHGLRSWWPAGPDRRRRDSSSRFRARPKDGWGLTFF